MRKWFLPAAGIFVYLIVCIGGYLFAEAAGLRGNYWYASAFWAVAGGALSFSLWHIGAALAEKAPQFTKMLRISSVLLWFAGFLLTAMAASFGTV